MRTCTHCAIDKPLSEFYVCAGNKSGYQSRCKDCCKASVKAWGAANPERRKEIKRASSTAMRRRLGIKPAVRRTREETLALKRAQENARYQAERGRIKARIASWKRANPSRVAATNAKRKAAELRATVSWANEFFISEAYDLARLRTQATGFPWHVDHVVPLKHPLVCGLHNEFNLRVIPGAVNASKSNRYWPDSWERAKEALA